MLCLATSRDWLYVASSIFYQEESMTITAPKTYQVVLTTTNNTKQFVNIAKVASGQYRILSAQGLSDMNKFTLGFEVTNPRVTNLDFTSDNFTCFALSEHLKLAGPEFLFKDNTFFVASLEHLQASLDQLRGAFVGSAEY